MSIHVGCSINVHGRSMADMTGSHSVTQTAAALNLSWSQLHFLSQSGRSHWEWMGNTAFPPPCWIWSEPDLVKQSQDRKAHVGQYLNCCLTNLHPLLNVCWQCFLSYPLPCSSSNRWVAFSSLPYSAQHDLNQSCLLSVGKSCTTKIAQFLLNATYKHYRKEKNRDIPSSPGNGSSSSKLIIHSQSFSSSAPHSQRESTR